MHRLIIVTGLPAAGKTTLSQRLAADLKLPLLNRDRLKETLFDTLGWQDGVRQGFGGASFKLFYQMLEVVLQTGHSCVVEANFIPRLASQPVADLLNQYGYQALQILCVAHLDILAQRFHDRDMSGTRHPGHRVTDPQFNDFAVDAGPLAIAGHLISLDTSDFARLDYPALLNQVVTFIQA